MFLELSQIKKHLNIDTDYTDDDQYLLFLYDVAVDVIQKHIDTTFEEIMQKEGKIPNALLHAMLLFIGNMYDNRESVSYKSVHEVPSSLTYILNMYRDYSNPNSVSKKDEEYYVFSDLKL